MQFSLVSFKKHWDNKTILDAQSIECLLSTLYVNNSFLHGLPDTPLQRLQTVPNSAAHMLIRTPWQNHITHILQQLHWLPVQQCIIYKVLMIAFNALHKLAPAYIKRKWLNWNLSLDDQCDLRINIVLYPVLELSHMETKAVRVFTPVLWNKLPISMCKCDDISVFKRHMKTYL